MARQEVPPQQVDACGMRMMNNALWIPERAVELQLRLCVDNAALQDTERTKQRLAQSRRIWHGQRWPRMSRSLYRTVCTELQQFLKTSCLAHCVPIYTQPSPTRSCTSTSFTSGCPRDGKYQYLLLLKDDFSGYLWLVQCRTADSAATADELIRRFAVFGVVLLWISDRGSQFKNEVVLRVKKELKAKHHFLRRIARGRTALSSPHASKSYVLFVQCYQS
jgi:hypothetical protein